MASLRLLLLAAGALLLIMIAWVGRRGSRQAAGDALHALRAGEPAPQAPDGPEAAEPLPSMRVEARAPGVVDPLPVLHWESGEPVAGESAEAAGGDPANPDAAEHAGATLSDGAEEIAARATTTRLPEQAFARLNPAIRIEWPLETARRICALRVMPRIRDRLSGRDLRLALEAQGLRHGPLGIYHLPDYDGVSLLCAASLAKPGMLDPQQMDFQSFSGVNLFIVLPGAEAAEHLVDRLVDVARELCQRLDGRIHDDSGAPMGALRLAELRQQVSDEDYGGEARPAGG